MITIAGSYFFTKTIHWKTTRKKTFVHGHNDSDAYTSANLHIALNFIEVYKCRVIEKNNSPKTTVSQLLVKIYCRPTINRHITNMLLTAYLTFLPLFFTITHVQISGVPFCDWPSLSTAIPGSLEPSEGLLLIALFDLFDCEIPRASSIKTLIPSMFTENGRTRNSPSWNEYSNN